MAIEVTPDCCSCRAWQPGSCRIVERPFRDAGADEPFADDGVVDEFPEDGQGPALGEAFRLSEGVADAKAEAVVFGELDGHNAVTLRDKA